MLGDLRQLMARLDRLKGDIAKHRTKQVERASVRDAAKALVDTYFRDIRSQVSDATGDPIVSVDRWMQDLLSLTHHRSTTSSYKTTIQGVRRSLEDLERSTLVPPASRAPAVEPIDLKILGVLKPLLPSAAASYEQALSDLLLPQRLSWRGPATDLREALRETLDHLAPDTDVTSSHGFKLDSGATSPTMKQKVRFLLKKRGLSLSATQAPESAADAVDTAVGTFVRSVYTRSSVSTHTPTNKGEVVRIRDLVRVVLCELLEIR